MSHHHHGHSCEHEHHDHSGGDGHSHEDDLTPALQSSLYQHIDFDRIVTYNEETQGSGKAIVKKSWDERLSETPVLESDADEQILMYIPFTGQIKLHSLLFRAPPDTSAPNTLKLFTNRDDLDFTSVSDLQPIQTLTLPLTPTTSDGTTIVEMPVKRALFNNTHSLTLFFEDNHSGGDEDVTRLSYLGFKGSWAPLNREAVNVLYEAAANPRDHKNLVPGANYGSMSMK
ncbi:DUF1000-domain-containing protein [Ascodesmis nigricans]|uniref:DUF1000-domain-containing protein n=1 Tax=Ascodesmis nigricans TaxID=341454 RepID=A0A4S2ML27_9PEZI|nr:DUF1000-domain-containing protein [Ascodesmis nigricans]